MAACTEGASEGIVLSYGITPLYVPYQRNGKLFIPCNRSWVLGAKNARGIILACVFPPNSLLQVNDSIPVGGIVFHVKTDGCRIWGRLENTTCEPQQITPRMDLVACTTTVTHFQVPDQPIQRITERRKTKAMPLCMHADEECLSSLKTEFPGLFRPDKYSNLGCTKRYVVSHIPFITCLPFRRQPSHPMPPSEAEAWYKEVQRLCKLGILKESKDEPYLIPVFGVAKQTGDTRWVLDFRRFNTCCKQEPITPPHRDYALAKIKPYVIGTSLDLSDAYYQVPLCSRLWHYFGVQCSSRYYTFTRLPFGYHNSPFEFLRALRCTLVKVDDKISSQLAWYMDDLLLLSSSRDIHMRDLHLVLGALATDGWTLRPDKCVFFSKTFAYLGVNVEPTGVVPHAKFYKHLHEIPYPETQQQWRRVRGWLVQLQRFIYKGSEVQAALIEAQASPSPRSWTGFLNTLVSHTVRCTHATNYGSFAISVDSSAVGWGACLTQGRFIIGCCTGVWPTSITHQLSNVLELEALCRALSTFRPWIFHSSVDVYTDNAATYSLGNPSHLSPFLRRRLDVIMAFTPRLRFLPGSGNVFPDFLSRQSSWVLPSSHVLALHLFFCSETQWKEGHQGHMDAHRTRDRLLQMGVTCTLSQVKARIDRCLPCVRFRSKRPALPWSAIKDPTTPGEIISADFLGPLRRTSFGVQYILIIVDHLTRLCFLWPTTSTTSATLTHGLEQWILRQQVNPQKLMTDGASYCTSREMHSWCEERGIEHIVIAPYAHMSLGLCERMNQNVLGRVRRLLLGSESQNWVRVLGEAESSINTTIHSVTQFTPQILWNAGQTEWNMVLQRTNNYRRKVRHKMARKVRNVVFVRGQKVWIWDYAREAGQHGDKLSPFWYGPGTLYAQKSKSIWEVLLEDGRHVFVHTEGLQRAWDD